MKKWVCALTAAVLMASSVATAFGASADAGMEAAVLAAKRVLDIPAACTEFSGSSLENTDQHSGNTIWELSWNSPDGEQSVSAHVDAAGRILNMESRGGETTAGLGNVVRAQGRETAEAFLRKVLGEETAATLSEVAGDQNAAARGDTMRYTFRRQHQGIPMLCGDVEIRVSRYSGKVVSYSNWQAAELAKAAPEEPGELLGTAESVQAFFRAYPLQLSYRSYYNYDKKELSVFTVYESDVDALQAIDGRTGEAVSGYENDLNEEYFKSRNGASAEDSAMETGGASGGGLTEQEQREMEAVAGLLSSERAEAVLRSAFPELKTTACQSKRLRTVTDGPTAGQYLWELTFESGYGRLDAKSGEVLTFYLWNDRDEKDRRDIGEASAQAIAKERFSDVFSGAKAAQAAAVEPENDEGASSYTFRWDRQANGIPYVDNGVSITVDGATGEVTSYRCSWYDRVEFPSLSGAMAQEAAQTAYAKLNGLGIYYMQIQESGAYRPVFRLSDSRPGSLMDAASGVALDYKGTPVEQSSRPEYSDIDGHWGKAAVMALLENGYYLEGDRFLPNQVITQKEFLTYLYGSSASTWDEDNLYRRAVGRGLLTEEEKNPNAALSRAQASKIVVRYLGLEEAAKHPEIFARLFSDDIKDEYRGYASICKGLGIMDGNKEGRFAGESPMTRAAAASVLYRMLSL